MLSTIRVSYRKSVSVVSYYEENKTRNSSLSMLMKIVSYLVVGHFEINRILSKQK